MTECNVRLVQVSLWKENIEGQWACVSNVVKGQGQLVDSS